MATMIKFRAWYMPFGKYGAMQEMVFRRASHILALAEMEPEKYIPEQFTGLTDVNGKDIYEGDILENRKYRSIVKFASGKFLADVVGTISRFDLIGETHGSKVIGNVHENPELLEMGK
ncbi:YopX family protein [Lactiplantibacillus plantarum]|uniref:YopX family protein n=1 Tax=Lactiplantibacillus plantarum TaxID=1590 RepID=UPI003B5150FE